MKMGRYLRRFALASTLLSLLVLAGIGTSAFALKEPDAVVPGRADLIILDALTSMRNLQRPPVYFLHDSHTRALKAQYPDQPEKVCQTCHLVKEKYLSPKFKRLEDTTYDQVMEIYHQNCIGCHEAYAAEGASTGPLVCGKCHVKSQPVAASRIPMGLDKSLHYRHSKARQEKCADCHHEFNEKTRQLYYEKGKEGTCRYCHQEETRENRISMKLASHYSCLECHKNTIKQGEAAGPLECAGCHSPEARRKIEPLESVPRMERNQPDATFVETGVKGDGYRMAPVPFAHKDHEAYTDTCRVCHHAAMDSCSKCHPLMGSAEGDFVNLEKAMHQNPADESCIGCHAKQKTARECAGCHEFMQYKKPSERSCLNCHTALPPAEGETAAELSNELAAELLGARQPVTTTYETEALPGTVSIGVLSQKYEPAEFPHRKIVNALMKGIEGSRLAVYQHHDKGTMCQGCHHNSPSTPKPPKCGSCHGRNMDNANVLKPALQTAYHQQCMGCHHAMGIEKPAAVDCTACHKEKSKR